MLFKTFFPIWDYEANLQCLLHWPLTRLQLVGDIWRRSVVVFFSCYRYPLVPGNLLKSILSWLLCSYLCHISNAHISMGLIWNYLLYSLKVLISPCTTPNYICLIISLLSWRINSAILFLFFKSVLALLAPLNFHINLKLT